QRSQLLSAALRTCFLAEASEPLHSAGIVSANGMGGSRWFRYYEPLALAPPRSFGAQAAVAEDTFKHQWPPLEPGVEWAQPNPTRPVHGRLSMRQPGAGGSRTARRAAPPL